MKMAVIDWEEVLNWMDGFSSTQKEFAVQARHNNMQFIADTSHCDNWFLKTFSLSDLGSFDSFRICFVKLPVNLFGELYVVENTNTSQPYNDSDEKRLRVIIAGWQRSRLKWFCLDVSCLCLIQFHRLCCSNIHEQFFAWSCYSNEWKLYTKKFYFRFF